MAYFLDFDERALKEWRKLGSTVREQLKKKLVEVLESPRIEANKLRGMPDCYKIKLRGMPDCYKIKLRSSGYRLVYQVIDEKVVVFVISVGKRERSEVYSEAVKRIL
ncbi:type II toxin-antitoxin system RelE/ParE family toxin [Escherichia coli]|nr:type II toxin-antitoxin system RelE/ParE family toxin [Escherichia coli]